MTPEAVVALLGLAFTVISAIALGAYHMGAHSNRIRSLEKRQEKAEAKGEDAAKDIGDLKTGVAGLTAKLGGLETTVTTGFEALTELITGKAPRARPRPKP